jgi:hypothetical protein
MIEIDGLLLSSDQAHRRRLTSFLDLASGVVLLGIFHVFFLLYQFSYGSQSVHSCAAGLAAGPPNYVQFAVLSLPLSTACEALLSAAS